MKISIASALSVILGCFLCVPSANAELVFNFNFNDLSISSASAPGSGGVPETISASQGAGSLSLTGWAGLVDDFGGSTINALGGDASGASLSLVGQAGNGSFIELQTSLVGLQDAVITFATRGTGTGFDSGLWSWSTNGTDFTAIAGNTATRSTSYGLATVDFTGISELTNASDAFFRYTLTGATSDAGNNRIDNLQLNATIVPEPSSFAVVALVGLAFASRRRRV